MAISLNFLGLIESGCGSSWRARTGFGENELAEETLKGSGFSVQ